MAAMRQSTAEAVIPCRLHAFEILAAEMWSRRSAKTTGKPSMRFCRCENCSSLFTPEIRSIKTSGFDQRWCANAAKVRGLPYEILAKRARALSANQQDGI